MARQKGTPKTGGRTRGTPNRDTLPIKDFLTSLLTKDYNRLEREFWSLDPLDRWKLWERLAGFVTPKQKAIEASVSFDALSEETIDAIAASIVRESKTQSHEDTD